MKPWKSIDAQIGVLKSKGMVITDEARAAQALERFGYYRLSGYWFSFRAKDEMGQILDHFTPDTHLSEIVDLYVFDKRLRLLALDALERIELALQVDVASTLGQHDPVAHTKAEFLNQKFVKNGQADRWIRKYGDLKSRSDRRAFVRHNLDTYGELPIWVAIEIFDFGALSHLFKMMRRQDRDRIAGKYGLSGGHVLEQWLKSLTYLRNVAAHHERLWNNNIKDHAAVPPQFSQIAHTNQYRPFRYFCIMQFFLEQLCPRSSWRDRVREHLLNFPTPTNGKVHLSDMGVVEGWDEWALWRPKNEN
ncbi:Abi family protein [Roseovarius nitratireducens]|uniref:Abi family protein n=1 Tax=Roseovarius nitratireducens TaxID=2044597 RepID=UPI0019812A58|nr:Abi family protein [Roseovarius nitratireducens]